MPTIHDFIIRRIIATIVVFIIIIIGSFFLVTEACAQVAPQVTNLRFNSPNIAFDGTEGNTADEQNTNYVTKIHQNGMAPRVVTATCTGTAKPWVCQITETNLEVGYNIYYVTIQKSDTVCAALPPGDPSCVSSGFSNPLIVWHGVSQKEIITNTQVQTVIKCVPGSYLVKRITNANILQAEANSVTGVISNILATSNAIYIFSCTPTP